MADVMVYSMRDFDEQPWYEQVSRELGLSIRTCPDRPSMDNIALAEGCRCLSIITTGVTGEMEEEFYRRGVRFISTRTIGYDHIDLAAARRLGIGISNVAYDPDGVADYTVMLLLMVIRRVKPMLARASAQDYTLNGLLGPSLKELCVGVVGTGRIGKAVIRRLQGFGCRVLAYSPHEDDGIRSMAEYVPLEELLAQSDVVSLHAALAPGSEHLLDRSAINRMKDGAVVINTARGGLIDTAALIDALESGKLSGAGLDVLENENALFYTDLRGRPLPRRDMHILKGMPNVIFTPHMAFYTQDAIRDMVKYSLESCRHFLDGTPDPMRVL